jgi:predicted Fe-Mo cluster-binding NifX family protein
MLFSKQENGTMKIAISADGPGLHSNVGQRLGTSPYLIILNLKNGEYEVLPNTGLSGQRGAGLPILMLAVKKGIKTVITGYCNPAIKEQFIKSDIDIITGISGGVEDAVERYKNRELDLEIRSPTDASPEKIRADKSTLTQAFQTSVRQLVNLLPILTGVVLIIGLFNALVSKSHLAAIFTGNKFMDTFWGACLGSLMAGNPINSYVIGNELMGNGISLFAVTALIVTWVTVGLIQLPAEATALGKKFALLRNSLSFLLSIPIALATVLMVNFIGE